MGKEKRRGASGKEGAEKKERQTGCGYKVSRNSLKFGQKNSHNLTQQHSK